MQKSLRDGAHLQSAVDFLRQTSSMIRIFRDRRPITDPSDKRLAQLTAILAWFDEWEKDANKETSKLARASLPSSQCMEDVRSMLHTFPEVCRVHLQDFPDGCVNPSRFNSDPVENHFCQTRGLKNGNTTNPTYQQYRTTVNSIVLGQSLQSRGRRSNAGIATAKPFNFYTSAPLSRGKSSRNRPTRQLRV